MKVINLENRITSGGWNVVKEESQENNVPKIGKVQMTVLRARQSQLSTKFCRSLAKLTLEWFSSLWEIQERLRVVVENVCLFITGYVVKCIQKNTLKWCIQVVLFHEHPVELVSPEFLCEGRGWGLSYSFCIHSMAPVCCLKEDKK